MRGMDLLHVQGAVVRTESDKMTRCSIEVDAKAEAVLNRLSIPDADLSVSNGNSAYLACYYSFGNRGGKGKRKIDRQTDKSIDIPTLLLCDSSCRLWELKPTLSWSKACSLSGIGSTPGDEEPARCCHPTPPATLQQACPP